MKPVHQTQFGPLDAVDVGNCYQACVASILELSLEAVPHFIAEGEPEVWWPQLTQFLEQYGLYPLCIAAESMRPDVLGVTLPRGYHLIGGNTPGGSSHTVVGLNGEIAHDPHPDKPGLELIDEITLFVSLVAGAFYTQEVPDDAC